MPYSARISWERRTHEPFIDGKYLRAHTWSFDGGIDLPASSSPHVVPLQLCDASAVDPEEAFVASLSSCHMLWFLSIAAGKKLLVERYVDNAEGVLEKDSQGRLAMTRVTLRPEVTFGGSITPSSAQIDELHHLAHDKCFLANSVKTTISVEHRLTSLHPQ